MGDHDYLRTQHVGQEEMSSLDFRRSKKGFLGRMERS